MPHRSRALAFFLAFALAAPANLALAAPKKTLRSELPAAAQSHWDTALTLYEKGDWDGARTSFGAAYEASKNPRVLFNVAVCEKNMSRYARAIDTFKRELVEGKATLSAEEDANIHAQITGLEKYVAQLAIDVNEAGADVFVDDVKVGVSPLPAPVSVQLGERRVRASKAGFSDAIESKELKGGGNGIVTLKLVPFVRTSLVNVTVIGPANATVKIDGKEVGQAPYTGRVTINEPHQFTADATGYVPASQTIIARENEATNLTLQLAEEQGRGKLVVVARPTGATIEIDGRVVGASRWEGPVTVGNHQIAVKKEGYYGWTYDVDVPRGSERQVTATLNENRNTSFVPWLVGTVLVLGASTVAVYFLTKPKDEDPVKGSLPPFALGTQAVRW